VRPTGSQQEMDRNLKELTETMHEYLQGEIIKHEKKNEKLNFLSIPNNATDITSAEMIPLVFYQIKPSCPF
jgi:hypothetical protein